MIRTERLCLRQWKSSDLEPFARMNADPEVMKFIPSLWTREQSDRHASLFSEQIEKEGWGLWAAAVAESDRFIGFIGLRPVPYTTPFTPAVEVGWRLSREEWGKGYATEGARAALEYGFKTLHLEEIVSFTTLENKRSLAVMERIGMKRDLQGDFDHPSLPREHPLCRHLLYRIARHF